MEVLQQRDLRAILEFLGEAADFVTLDAFRTGILPGLRRLVPCDMCGYNEVDARRGRTFAVTDPPDAAFPGVEETFSRWVHQHPLVRIAAAGDGRAYRLSDFLTQAELHRLELYQEVYRRLGAEYQIAFALSGEVVVGIAMNRRSHDFSERDRIVLNTIRPHVLAAYERAGRHDRAQARIASLEAGLEQTGGALVLLHGDGTLSHADARARRLLHAYGMPAVHERASLPTPLGDWVGAALRGRGAAMLTFEGPDGRLTARLLGDEPAGHGPVLLLDETLGRGPSLEQLERLGLTRRQACVLELVARGRSDQEIAAGLSITRATVRKHLEGIYAKLGVHSRTAAASLARDAAGR